MNAAPTGKKYIMRVERSTGAIKSPRKEQNDNHAFRGQENPHDSQSAKIRYDRWEKAGSYTQVIIIIINIVVVLFQNGPYVQTVSSRGIFENCRDITVRDVSTQTHVQPGVLSIADDFYFRVKYSISTRMLENTKSKTKQYHRRTTVVISIQLRVVGIGSLIRRR